MTKKEIVKKILKIYEKSLKISFKEKKTHYNRLIRLNYDDVYFIYNETLKIYKMRGVNNEKEEIKNKMV